MTTTKRERIAGPCAGKNTRPDSNRVREQLQDQSSGRPVWIRAPKTGPEFHTGFTRGKLYELAGKGAIRSVSVREPGQIRGTRLFNLSSVLEFIARCESAGGKVSL